jgi:diamine N-acetyltransferase
VAKRTIPPLVGNRVRLRLLEEADLPQTRAWRNQAHIRRWFVNSSVIEPEQHQRWFEAYRDRDDDFVFIIEETQDLRKPIGQVALYRIDWDRGKAEYGRLMIGEADAAGRGLAREATDVLLRFATTTLKIHEIELEVFADNAAAIKIYAACGFRVRERSGSLLRMVRDGIAA